VRRDGDQPEFNSVDASRWYVIAVHELLAHTANRPDLLSPAQRESIERAVRAIVSGYAAGARFGIRMDDDGLLAAGVPGVQLTWMDAKIGEWVVTPRVRKPVEIQALWINALAAAARLDDHWTSVQRRATAALGRRFWNPESQCLFDVVDVDHVAGTVDASIRPNQILAVGGLRLAVVVGARARQVVDMVEQRLLTPMGLRSLAPGTPSYAGRYLGDAFPRDSVYHQGTVWPWLIGPFVEAWLRVRRPSVAVRQEGRERFLAPLLDHLATAGVGHVSEIAEGDAPFTPRGCPFQAWSMAEVVRVDRQVLAVGPAIARPRHDARRGGHREIARPRDVAAAHEGTSPKSLRKSRK
jgi:glycogen debranching enzyme